MKAKQVKIIGKKKVTSGKCNCKGPKTDEAGFDVKIRNQFHRNEDYENLKRAVGFMMYYLCSSATMNPDDRRMCEQYIEINPPINNDLSPSGTYSLNAMETLKRIIQNKVNCLFHEPHAYLDTPALKKSFDVCDDVLAFLIECYSNYLSGICSDDIEIDHASRIKSPLLFAKTCCNVGDGNRVSIQELWTAYDNWFHNIIGSGKCLSKKVFNAMLVEKYGLTKGKGRVSSLFYIEKGQYGRYLNGIALRKEKSYLWRQKYDFSAKNDRRDS